MTQLRLCLFISTLSVLAACATPTEEHLLQAKDAFDRCDLRAAHQHFDAAYASDGSHPDAALGFALTDTVLLPEDPEVTAALADIGFTAPLDSELLLFGSDSILERLRRGDSCDSVEEFVRTGIPYPPLSNSNVDGRDLIRADLTAQQLVDRLRALDGRFERLASAYETAASSMDGREIVIEGSCGFGRMVVQAPELYAAAAAFVFVRAAIAIAPGYDWSFTVRDFVARDPAVQASALSTLLALRDGARAEQGRALLIRGLKLAQNAVNAAEGQRTPVADATFDWSAMDRIVLSDLAVMIERAIESLETHTPREIPFMTPTITMDVSGFLSSPPDSASLAVPLWTVVETSSDYTYLRSNSESWQELLTPYFSPAPWELSVEWAISNRWSDVELGPVFDPGDRYETLYMCD